MVTPGVNPIKRNHVEKIVKGFEKFIAGFF